METALLPVLMHHCPQDRCPRGGLGKQATSAGYTPSNFHPAQVEAAPRATGLWAVRGRPTVTDPGQSDIATGRHGKPSSTKACRAGALHSQILSVRRLFPQCTPRPGLRGAAVSRKTRRHALGRGVSQCASVGRWRSPWERKGYRSPALPCHRLRRRSQAFRKGHFPTHCHLRWLTF